jgi:hypothetical protein
VVAEELQHRRQHPSRVIDVDVVTGAGDLHQPRVGNLRDDLESSFTGEQRAFLSAEQ